MVTKILFPYNKYFLVYLTKKQCWSWSKFHNCKGSHSLSVDSSTIPDLVTIAATQSIGMKFLKQWRTLRRNRKENISKDWALYHLVVINLLPGPVDQSIFNHLPRKLLNLCYTICLLLNCTSLTVHVTVILLLLFFGQFMLPALWSSWGSWTFCFPRIVSSMKHDRQCFRVNASLTSSSEI